jgi:hypothetical protein
MTKHRVMMPTTMTTKTTPSRETTHLQMAYVRQEDDSSAATTTATTTTTTTQGKAMLTPKVGDIVRYYDLDGGKSQGEELVAKITFLTKTRGTSSSYLAELTQLESLGEGYFSEYSSTKRMSKKTDRDISQVSPLRASFVRSEQAYMIPFDVSKGTVKVRQEQYDLDDWEGPAQLNVNQNVVEADGVLYSQLKNKLLKNAALTGLLGTVLVNVIQGTEEAVIYFTGAAASVAYLFLLSIKTDTMGSPDRKLGSNVSNLRFIMPVLVLVGVALYNKSMGDANPLALSDSPFESITKEQFGAAVLGFLTYRVPLFLGQIQEALQDGSGDDGDDNTLLPGSAGVALKLAQGAVSTKATAAESAADLSTSLIPVLLISGPQATGRDELVERLLQEDDRLVRPILVDRLTDGVTFERLANRGEFLHLDPDERFGWTKDGILNAAAQEASRQKASENASSSSKVVVVNADVNLARKIQDSLSGARLIGVWVGLDSVQEFERRIADQIDRGDIVIDEEETRDTAIRARIKEIVQEIDYGLSSGIFEFTILNQDPAKSLKELKEAATYCFK